MANRDINFQKHHSTRQINLRVLLDLDQVLADFEGHFLKEFRKKYPDEPSVELEDREGFWLRDQYDILKPGLGAKCASIWNAKGFFQNLEEIPGAISAAHELSKMEKNTIRVSNGLYPDQNDVLLVLNWVQTISKCYQLTRKDVDVFICTSPVIQYKYCVREKYLWVEKHLGKHWVDKIILTKDKTMVAGHLLIDDKASITGVNPYPSWEHVVFSACHNRTLNLKGKRRLENWTDGSWRDLIEDFKKRI